MERPQGSVYVGGDNHLLDYWEEYEKMMEETKLLDDYLEEECPRNYDGKILKWTLTLKEQEMSC